MVESGVMEAEVYEASDGEVPVEARLERETVWLTQDQMATMTGLEGRSSISSTASSGCTSVAIPTSKQ